MMNKALSYGTKTLLFVRSHFNFYRATLFGLISLSLIGGILIYAFETHNPRLENGGPLPFSDALFTAASAICVTGLVSTDFSRLSIPSQVLVLVYIHLGGATTFTLPIVMLKRYYYRRQQRKIAARLVEEALQKHRVQLDPNLKDAVKRIEKSKEITNICDRLQLKSPLDDNYDKEYQAMGKLLLIVPLYTLACYTLAFLLLIIYFAASSSARAILPEAAHGRDTNYAWWTLFHVLSAFNNAGFSLNTDSLVPFVTDVPVILIISILIILGNTGFPLILRLLVWLGRRYSKDSAIYKFLLIKPRDCYTHLFPALQTRVLAVAWAGLLLSEFFWFLLLDFNNVELKDYNFGGKLIIGWMQAVTTRTAGFNSVSTGSLQYGMLVYTVLMMYIAAYPLVFSIRKSAKRKDKGKVPEAYKEDEEVQEVLRNSKGNRINPVEHHVVKPVIEAIRWWAQTLMLRDITWLCLAWFGVTALESDRISSDPNFTAFKIIFEVASAYGTVGLSMGHPNYAGSFTAALSTPSKLIIMWTLLIGRCRGLPDSLDYAVDFSKYENLSGSITPGSVGSINLYDDDLERANHHLSRSDDASDVELREVPKKVVFAVPDPSLSPNTSSNSHAQVNLLVAENAKLKEEIQNVQSQLKELFDYVKTHVE